MSTGEREWTVYGSVRERYAVGGCFRSRLVVDLVFLNLSENDELGLSVPDAPCS
jgi:hypothetical protein